MQKQTLIEKLATWINQQQKTGLNPAEKITEFNRLKDNYNSTTANLLGSEEMQQLIKLLVNVSESHWSEVKEAIEKSLLARIEAIKIPLASDEQILHFFLPNTELADTSGSSQKISAWMEAYPDYAISIWSDDSFDLAVKMLNSLQTKCGIELESALANHNYNFATTLETLMLKKRGEAFNSISEKIQKKTEAFRDRAYRHYIATHRLTETERNALKNASLADFLRSLSLDEDKIDQIRAAELIDYLKSTLKISESEIDNIKTNTRNHAQSLVTALQAHRSNKESIRHKTVTMNDALNSRYLMKLILLANKPEAIHSIRLSILKTNGGLFINPASSRNPLFNNNPLKVDPLLGAAYSEDLAVVMAKKDSLFINALFEHEEKIKAVLAAFTGIQHGNTPSKTLFGAIQSHLNTEKLSLSAQELALYAYESLRNPSGSDVSGFFAGERGYYHVFTQKIQSKIGDTNDACFKDNRCLPLIAPYIEGITLDTTATLVDPGPSMIANKESFTFTPLLNPDQPSSGARRYQRNIPNYSGTTQYTRQIVIQFTEDLAVNASAMAIHRKNQAISSLYRYHEIEKKLLPFERSAVTKQPGEVLRIILVGHASYLKNFPKNNDDQRIKDVLFEHNLLEKNQTIAKLSVVACWFEQGAENTSAGTHTLGEGPAKRLFEEFVRETNLERAVTLEKMTVRQGYLSIDNNGQKWISVIGDHTKKTVAERGYLSKLASSTEARIEIYQENSLIKYQRRPIEGNTTTITKIFPNNFNRFGLFSPVEINTKTADGVPISQKKAKPLNGVLDTTVGSAILNNSGGNIVINAGSMALLAAMTEETQSPRVMIIDKDPYQIDALQKALIATRDHKTFTAWIAAININDTVRQQLNNFLASDPKINTYYQAMRTRTEHISYDFFYADIHDGVSLADLLIHKGNVPITLIHLDVDPILLDNQAILDREVAQKQVKTRIGKLTQSLRTLSDTNTPATIYLYSLADNDYKTLSSGSIDSLPSYYTGLENDNYDYVTKMQLLNGRKNALLDPLTLVRQATHILAADQAIKKLEGNKRQIPGSSTAVNLPRRWIPLMSEIEYDVSAKNFKVPYVDLNNPSKKEILTTDSKNFALAKQALDRQNSALNQYFELHDDQPQLKVSTGLNQMGAISMGSSSLFATLAIWGWIKNGITVQGNDGLAQALQIHTYVSMNAVAQSVISDGITLGNFAQSKIHLALKSALAKGSVGSFARGLRSFGGKIMWLGPLFDIADIALSSTEYHLAKNEAQANIFRTEIIFGSISLGLSLGFIVASMLGATLLSTLLLPIGLLLAGLRYLVVSALATAETDREKAKIINDYFQQMQDGWNNAGFKLENGVLLPYQGVVIEKLDLRNPARAAVVFDPQGLKIIRALFPTTLPTEFNLYSLCENVKTTFALSNEAGTIRSLILPMTSAATMTPSYTDMLVSLDIATDATNRITFYLGADFDALHRFHHQVKTRNPNQYDSLFIVRKDRQTSVEGRLNVSVPTELSFAYRSTTVEILLGEHHYALIAPGISEGTPLADSPYKTLDYHLKGSPTGQAKVILVLNPGQGAIKIDCNNQKIEWIIEASHLPFIELRDDKEGTHGRKLTFSSKKLLANGAYEDETIAIITISDSTTTRLRIQLKRGVITLPQNISQNSYHYPIRYALPALSQGNNHTLQEVNQFISAKANYPQITHYLKIDNFKINEANNENCFYLKDLDKVVYIQDTSSIKFSQARLMFYNDKYVFYQGDITFAMLNGIANQTLKQVFWISTLGANVTQQIYLPLLHLFDPPQGDQTDRKQAASVIIQTQILEKGILFKQKFTDIEGHSLFLTYLIETQNNANKLYLLEIQGLSVSDRASLTDDILNKIKALMITSITFRQYNPLPHPLFNNVASENYTPGWSDIILPAASSLENHNDVTQLALPQNTSRILIGDRLIWPMPNSLKGVTGTITARLAAATLADTKYHIHLVGIVPGNKIEDHYYFWEVTEADNYNQFHALYLQHADNNAKEIDLTPLGLSKTQIEKVTGADKGVYLHMRDSLRAYLTTHSLANSTRLNADDTRVLSATQTSINNFGAFLLCKEDKIYLGHANNQQGVWMLDSPVTREKVIRYLPGENITPEMFSYNGKLRAINALLRNAVILPSFSIAESESGKLPNNETVVEASMAANGSLQLITSSGLVLAVTVDNPSNPPRFAFDLIGVTPFFCQKYQQDETQIKTVFSGLLNKLTLPEIIALPYDKQTDWYHAKSETLFITRSHVPYLGCNTASKTAYFTTTNGDGDRAQLMTVAKPVSATASNTLADTIPSNFPLSGHYSRQADILMLNADYIDQPHDYLSLDGVSHFLLQIRQTKSQPFTFALKRLPYPIIGILHDADRQIICQIDATITPQKVLMKRQDEKLQLFIGNQWLIIDAAFSTSKTHLNKLKLVFQGYTTNSQGYATDLQQLVNRYKNVVTEKKETDPQITILN